mmetsp:Transcript_58737/g.155391  ORF Transcript_58737/g.155391 Transcript_58737/m.155391 type:complete len:491 (-) Transcript_58737:1581-3053(-)
MDLQVRQLQRGRGAQQSDRLLHRLRHHHRRGHPRGPAPRRHHFPCLLGAAHAKGHEPGARHGRVRDHGRRHQHLQRQDGHPHREHDDRRPGLLRRQVLAADPRQVRLQRPVLRLPGPRHRHQLPRGAGQGASQRPHRGHRQQDGGRHAHVPAHARGGLPQGARRGRRGQDVPLLVGQEEDERAGARRGGRGPALHQGRVGDHHGAVRSVHGAGRVRAGPRRGHAARRAGPHQCHGGRGPAHHRRRLQRCARRGGGATAGGRPVQGYGRRLAGHRRHPRPPPQGGTRGGAQVPEGGHHGAHDHRGQPADGQEHRQGDRHPDHGVRHRGARVPPAEPRGAEGDAQDHAGDGAVQPPGQADHGAAPQGDGRGGGGDGRRHQRRPRAQGGRRGPVHGHHGHPRGAGGLGHRHHGRQLLLHRQVGAVGPVRLRQHPPLPAVPAHRQRVRLGPLPHGRHHGLRHPAAPHPPALGQPHHGHPRRARPRHGAAYPGHA